MKALKIFENKKIRSSWNDEQEKWYFSIIDVIEVLTDSPRPRKYWNALKNKLQAEGSELSQKLGQLKMQAEKECWLTPIISNNSSLTCIFFINLEKNEG